MATNVQQIAQTLAAFYDFTDKTVVDVGAGGGQLVEFARPARRVIAVDQDRAALDRLAARLGELCLAGKFALLEGDLLQLCPRGDVVLLEFCLHQMPDPERALSHARGLAPDLLVIEHASHSLWEWYGAEDARVAAAWRAVEREPIRRRQDVEAVQAFADYAALEGRLALQGPESLRRIAAFRGQRSITIPMPYRLVLL